MCTAINNKSVIERYRSLPEAGRIPDAVWDWAKQDDYIADLERQAQAARNELAEIQHRAIETMRKDWTDDDIKAAGLF